MRSNEWREYEIKRGRKRVRTALYSNANRWEKLGWRPASIEHPRVAWTFEMVSRALKYWFYLRVLEWNGEGKGLGLSKNSLKWVSFAEITYSSLTIVEKKYSLWLYFEESSRWLATSHFWCRSFKRLAHWLVIHFWYYYYLSPFMSYSYCFQRF